MSICDTCPCDEAPFTTFGALVLCARCSKIVIDHLSDSVDQTPTDATASGSATAPSADAVAINTACSAPRRVNGRPHVHAVCVVSAQEKPRANSNPGSPLGSPVATSTASFVPEVSRDDAAGVALDMPDLPPCLDRRNASASANLAAIAMASAETTINSIE